MSLQPDYYKVLNLQRSAGDNDIKNSYRKLALKVNNSFTESFTLSEIRKETPNQNLP
jgi:preprotein translocase subunit Sec63